MTRNALKRPPNFAPRWIVSIPISSSHSSWFRSLRIPLKIRHNMHENLMTLAASLICWRQLVRWFPWAFLVRRHRDGHPAITHTHQQENRRTRPDNHHIPLTEVEGVMAVGR